MKEVKLAEGQKKVEAELQEASGNMKRQEKEIIKVLDSHIVVLSEEIIKKLLWPWIVVCLLQCFKMLITANRDYRALRIVVCLGLLPPSEGSWVTFV